jgi:hypothetical protein
MARPRVFISSTFYDLRQVRGELERFIRDMGYEPVLNERGHISYGSAEALEKYCYKEIEKTNILVSIIGNKFGSQSRDNERYSISNMELRTAISQGKQVYVFVDNGVLSEYRTYLKNKDRDIVYHHVDDVRIYNFLEEVHALPFNNQIHGFDSIPKVFSYLKEQWAGLFESYLQNQAQEKIFQLTDTIKSTADTLKDLVELLRNEQTALQTSMGVRETALDAIIIQNHPIFSRLKKLTNTSYRVFFTNLSEMKTWLKARNWSEIDEILWEKPDFIEFIQHIQGQGFLLHISVTLFSEDGTLKMMLPGEWSDNLVRSKKLPDPPANNTDDEIPF